MVSLTPPNSNEAGQNVTVVCTITLVEGLVPQPVIIISRQTKGVTQDITQLTTTEVIDSDTINKTLVLAPLTYSDGGDYSCLVEVDIGLRNPLSGTDSFTLIVTSKYVPLDQL